MLCVEYREGMRIYRRHCRRFRLPLLLCRAIFLRLIDNILFLQLYVLKIKIFSILFPEIP